MCEICKNNRLNTEHSWGISFHPCPNAECREKAKAELMAYVNSELKKYKRSEIA